MKTAKYFDEYNEYVTGQRENINKIENERQELSQRIKEDKAKYKELIANSQDDEADALYTTFDSNEKKLKDLEKRLSTKKEVFDEARCKKAIELIKHQADLPHLYKKDKERILAKFEPIVQEYNKVVGEIAALNDEYEIEFDRFVRVYDKENFEKDKEVREEIRNHFRANQYTDYVSKSELPFINIKNKMEVGGTK